MGCAITKPGQPKTLRELQEIAGSVYSCLDAEIKKPACVKAGRCSCTDFLVEMSSVFLSGEGIEHCQSCMYVAEYLCDFPMGKGKTCDAPLCEDHAMRPGPLVHPLDELTARRLPEAAEKRKRQVATMDDTHFCPAHWAISQR